MLSFSLSTYIEGSFSLNCVNGKVAYSSSAFRSMTIFGEDGEGVLSFRFFSALTGTTNHKTTTQFHSFYLYFFLNANYMFYELIRAPRRLTSS